MIHPHSSFWKSIRSLEKRLKRGHFFAEVAYDWPARNPKPLFRE